EGEDSSSAAAMRQGFGSAAAVVAYLLFVLIYCPCLAVVGAIYQEAGLRWAIFSTVYLTVLAWVIATMFFQCTRFLAFPLQAGAWLLGCGAAIAAGIYLLHDYGKRQRV
ncbi:MAG: ferrous iron transporter B, partial [Kiritimatiellia bacterium]